MTTLPDISPEASLKYMAWAMIAATLSFFVTQQMLVYVGAVLLILTVFFYYHRARWRVFGRWGGVANGLTGLRAGLLLGAVMGSDEWPLYIYLPIGIVILVLDGLDGYYARKYGTVSAFGDAFDKEVDALFVLTYGILMVDAHLIGSWIVLPGLLRYGYVIGLSFLERQPSPTGKSFRRQFVGMWLMGTWLSPFVLPPIVYQPALVFATAIVLLSFVVDFYQAVQEQRVEVEA